MRSVVVVLPASMCALMPMLRYRSIGVVRATVLLFLRLALVRRVNGGCRGFGREHVRLKAGFKHGQGALLRTEVREGLVGLPPSGALPRASSRRRRGLPRLQKLRREPLAHRLLAALAGRFAQPAHRERHPAHRTHFDRDLEVGAADATALDLDVGAKFESAWLNTSSGSLPPFFEIDSKAPYRMRSATDFLPAVISTFTNFATSLLPYLDRAGSRAWEFLCVGASVSPFVEKYKPTSPFRTS
jgi:hypothetical protein